MFCYSPDRGLLQLTRRLSPNPPHAITAGAVAPSAVAHVVNAAAGAQAAAPPRAARVSRRRRPPPRRHRGF